MSFHRALGAFALAALVLAGCNKSADKGKTKDLFVSGGFTNEQASCMTDILWDKIPKKDLDKLTDPKSEPTDEQKTIIAQATVTCAKDKLIEGLKSELASANTSATPEQIDCIVGKISDADLLKQVQGDSTGLGDTITAATTACIS